MSLLVVEKGWGTRWYFCARCNHEAVRDDKHDAFWCRRCRIWLESTCSDADCRLCVDRPAEPARAGL